MFLASLLGIPFSNTIAPSWISPCSYLESPKLAAGRTFSPRQINAAKSEHVVEAQRNTPADVNTATRRRRSILVGDVWAQSCTSARVFTKRKCEPRLRGGKGLRRPWMNGNVAAPTGSGSSRPHGGAGMCFSSSPQLGSNAAVGRLGGLQK